MSDDSTIQGMEVSEKKSWLYYEPVNTGPKTILKELKEITICPITPEEFKDPYVFTDKQCYERSAIIEDHQ